jgi:hypothetical protein
VTEFYVFLLGLFLAAVAGVLGALLDRARARSGYLAKQYQDLLAQLFALQHTANAGNASEAKRQRDDILKGRPRFEAVVSLFDRSRVAKKLRTLYAELEKAETVPDQFDNRIESLTKAFHGPLVSRLSPQKRWFE